MERFLRKENLVNFACQICEEGIGFSPLILQIVASLPGTAIAVGKIKRWRQLNEEGGRME
jgi:hypothetical protein